MQVRLESDMAVALTRSLNIQDLRAGYDFLLLRERSGEMPGGLGDWWTQYQTAGEAQRRVLIAAVNEGDEEQPKRSPRRNRGGVTSKIFLSLGSNLNDPVSQIQRAIKTLASSVSTIECAPLYQSKPLGPQDQPDFVNTVISGYTDLSPEELLITIKGIERQQYRVKTKHWGPRTIDIDILFMETSK